MSVLLDTDILSLYLKKWPDVVFEGQQYLAVYGRFTFSCITRFEILRGMKTRQAEKQLSAFERFCLQNEVLDLNDKIIVRAADIYADLHIKGQLIGDADILIAATAIENGLPVVTNNESHFGRIPGLRTLNWNR